MVGVTCKIVYACNGLLFFAFAVCFTGNIGEEHHLLQYYFHPSEIWGLFFLSADERQPGT